MAEARVDEATIRFSREAERYARALAAAEEKLVDRAREEPPADPLEDLERAESEIARIKSGSFRKTLRIRWCPS